MITEKNIDNFIDFIMKKSLELKSSKGFKNIYEDEHIRENLRQYLLFLANVKPTFMLVGEAPGYKGCGLTGIPFLDERQLRNHDNDDLIGDWPRSERNLASSEDSATYIWEILGQTDNEDKVVPIIWNAFPFHPYKNTEKSNRTPNAAELKIGDEIREELQKLFCIKPEHTYGIGRTAQKRMNIEANTQRAIRHPAYGGKKACQEKLAEILEIERKRLKQQFLSSN